MKTLIKIALALALVTLGVHSCSAKSKVDPSKVCAVTSIPISVSLCQKFNWCPMFEVPRNASHHALDAIYIVPSSSDIVDLVKFFKKRKEFVSFTRDGWDCDNFAREFMHYASVWSRNHYGNAPAAIAVATVWVKCNGDVSDIFPGDHSLRHEYHVTNLILREDGQWFWFEPQSLALTPVESALYEDTLQVIRIEF